MSTYATTQSMITRFGSEDLVEITDTEPPYTGDINISKLQAAIDSAISQLWASDSKAPKALLAKTVKGKGVSFMEHNNMWHYTRLDRETYAQALSAVNGNSK